ncbi:hypothetical protein ABTZ03_31600 [Kitasatospora sp. NPDC096077]|uniref:hypothetical protein n=1 Tax=Kitasatospora sp. NPDC096077 TaxID=3155544 RepID=UPI00332B291E
MNMMKRLAAFAVATAMAGAGFVGISSTSASATTTALSCSNKQFFTGSGGHAGASIRCTGGPFVANVTCFKPSYGRYHHYGNRVESGGTSTVWCDLGATAESVTGLAS